MDLKNTFDFGARSPLSGNAGQRLNPARGSLWCAGLMVATLALPLALSGCGNKGTSTSGGDASAATSPDDALATVGDTTINRKQLDGLLETTGGESGLRQLIDSALVDQEVKAKNLTVDDAEVDAAVTERAKGNPNIAALVKSGGVQQETVRNSVRNQIGVERLLTSGIKEDPKAIAAWFAKNRKRFDQPARVKIGILFASTKKRIDILATQLKSGKTFLELVNEQTKTNDPVAKGSTNDTSGPAPSGAPGPGFIPVDQLGPMKAAVDKLKANETSAPIALPGGKTSAYALIRLIEREEAVMGKATDPKVVNEWKLEQVARQAAKQIAPKSTFEQVMGQAMQQLSTQAMQTGQMPTERDAISLINQSAVSKILTDLRGKAKVSISDPHYTRVAEAYKPVTTTNLGAPAGGAPAGGAPSSGAPADGAPAGGAPSSGAPSSGAPSSGAPSSGAPSSGAPATSSSGSTAPKPPAASGKPGG